ncbi:MAG: SoxR reducing system RseC family protein [candidate division WOR-3 bacterium]|nr:SoxR reducing system RseC family protein [candidate division WOR-3 bacterium]
MRESGKVVSTKNDRAEVEVAARGECEHCTAHGLCNWTGTNLRKVLAVNKAGAGAGDVVELETVEGTGAKSNLLVFGIPVVLMVTGVLIGGLLLRKDLWSGILAGVGLALGLGIVKIVDIAVNRSGKSLPVIVRLAGEFRSENAECRSQNEGERNESVDGSDAGRSPDDGVR